MSIEMDNPQTTLELVDASSNLVEQMEMAFRLNDMRRFCEVKKQAAEFLFDATRMIDQGVERREDLGSSET